MRFPGQETDFQATEGRSLARESRPQGRESGSRPTFPAAAALRREAPGQGREGKGLFALFLWFLRCERTWMAEGGE